MNRFYKLLFATVLVGAAVFTFGNSKVQAISSFFTDSNVTSTPGSNIYPLVSRAGTGITLTAETSYFRVFIPATYENNVEIKIYNACNKDPNLSEGDDSLEAAVLQSFATDYTNGVAGNSPMSNGGTKKNDSSNCISSTARDLVFLVSGSDFTVLPDRYGPDLKSAIVRIKKPASSGAGIKSVKINTSIGQVTYDDLGTLRSSDPIKPGDAAFALWDARDISTNPVSDIKFTFKPDCKYQGERIFMKWTDGDYGEPNQPNNNIGWKLRDMSASGAVVAEVSGSEIGGNGVYGKKEVVLNKTHTYEWRWENVNRTNGLQLWMPFSENSVNARCPVDLCKNLDGIQEVVPTGYTRDSSGNCNKPGTPTTTKNCSQFEHNMAAGSRYRFTVFNNRDVAHTSTPAEGTVVNDGNGWKYKTFNMAPVAQFDRDGGSVFKYDYPNPSRDWIVYIEKWEGFDPPGDDKRDWRYSDGNASPDDIGRSPQLDCYLASCNISVSGPNLAGDSNGYPANSTLTVTATMRNIGRSTLPENFGGKRLSLTENGSSPHYMGTSIDPGGEQTIVFNRTAEPARGAYSVSVYPDYYGLKGMGDACTTTYNVYQRYDFTATADSSLRQDRENPSQAVFTTTLTQTGVDVDSTSRRYFFKQSPGPVSSPLAPPGTIVDTGNFGNRPNLVDIYDIPFGSFRLDDIYCVVILLDYGHGWRGPGNNYLNESRAGATNCEGGIPPGTPEGGCPQPYISCTDPTERVTNNPYVRLYGNDIVTGAGFTNGAADCTSPASSGIFTFMRPLSEQISFNAGNPTSTGKSGSGAQLAAFARGQISGLTSASARTASPMLPNGLTFANTSPATPDNNSTSAVMGGGLTSDIDCAPDYFTETQFPDANTDKKKIRPGNSFAVAGLPNEEQSRFNTDLTLGGAPSFANRHTVYVDGDVFINSDIAYTPIYNTRIPNFTLVVRGNIYISQNVHQLDGLYIAQPNPTTPDKGRIYTCAQGLRAIPDPTQLYDDCGAADSAANPDNCSPLASGRQLHVNGAFIADRVVLNRTVYTLRCSTFKENADDSRAAEIFTFSPEIYLSPPVFSPRSTFTSGEYDYITTLPPTL